MTLFSDLIDVYNANVEQIWKKNPSSQRQAHLLPVTAATQRAQIEVIIDEGTFEIGRAHV